MSSRAFRRLHGDSDVIKLPVSTTSSSNIEGSSHDYDYDDDQLNPTLHKTSQVVNPFELLLEDEEGGNGDSDEQGEEEELHPVPLPPPAPTNRGNKRKKKKKKSSKDKSKEKTSDPSENHDEVDAAIKEVTEMLGGLETTGPRNITIDKTLRIRNVLCVNRRFLNADNEMRRIFGSRVVQAEQSQRKDHKRRLQKQTVLVTPKDTWPLMQKYGMSMQLIETSDHNCHHFSFEHNQDYQKIQFSFLDAVETYDPNAIGGVLHAHPYHIDSLLQLSEVCKMGEDLQMAADLIERALYHFECNFHPLFNLTQGSCRISYNNAENRSLFLAIFRHLNYVGRKGCHRTAFELCKLLLNLDPDTDPLCVLLMIDYHALRAYEYHFIIDLYTQWETKRNLSQLPNFAFSVPLAMFLASSDQQPETGIGNSGCGLLEQANAMLQESLIMFPSLLLPLLDKCGVTLKQEIMSHTHFSRSRRDSDALNLLIKLYIERNNSLWKVPEVLEWLGKNCLIVIKRVNERDPLVTECDTKRQKRYVGTPRNISRHVILCDHLQNITSALPTDITGTPIMMYDPLPPENSISSYSRPLRHSVGMGPDDDGSNPVMLFLRSLLPSYNTMNTDANTQPNLVGVPHQHQQAPPLNQQPPLLPGVEPGAMGGAMEGFALEGAVRQLTTSLRGLLEQLRPPPQDGDEQDDNVDDDDSDSN